MNLGMTAYIGFNVQFINGPQQVLYSVPLVSCTRLCYRWWSLKSNIRHQAQRLAMAATVIGIGLTAARFGVVGV